MAADPKGAALACAMALGLLACREAGRPAAADREWPAAELRSGGGPVAAALGPGQVHRYRLPLQRGQFLRLVVDQQGIDAEVALEDPNGARVLEADRPISDRGPELVLAVAATKGVHTLVIHGSADSGAGRYEARVEVLRPASAVDRRRAVAYQLFTGAKDLEPEVAMERRTRALAIFRELGEVALEAEVLLRVARQHHIAGEYQHAVDRCREAVAAFERAGNHRWEGMARFNLGASLVPLGEVRAAADQYAISLSLARREGDRITEAKALHGLGQTFQNQGELQQALDHYRPALALLPQDDRLSRPSILHQLGVLYARYFHDERSGRLRLLQALDAWGPGQERDKAATLSQLGRLSFEQGRLDEARRYYEEALALSSGCRSAVVRARLALVEEGQRARPAADTRMAEALRIVQTETCPKSQPTVHLLAAELAEGRGDAVAALASYRRAEGLFADLGDRLGMSESQVGIARSERSLGNRQEALAASRRALDILEGVRPTVLSEDLRTSFFSGAREAFAFQIDLLLEQGDEEEAWATAEEARARVLRDLLIESGAGLRRNAVPVQADQERALQRELNVLETRRLGAGESRPEKLHSLRQDIDAKIAELESLRGEIRRQNPLYASLTRSEPISLARTRRELLDDDTVLLEYRLGESASTVWAVTGDALTAFRLPPRREIEPVAREAAGSLRSLEYNPQPLCELSRMLLAPVTAFLAHRRIVVVADGALEALPFAALPVPSASAACLDPPVLVDTHEIVSLPSAAALLTQRRLLAKRRPAAGWLAAVADPVYRSGQGFQRLPGSSKEAKAIAAFCPLTRSSSPPASTPPGKR